jgi:hypothetical protein
MKQCIGIRQYSSSSFSKFLVFLFKLGVRAGVVGFHFLGFFVGFVDVSANSSSVFVGGHKRQTFEMLLEHLGFG